MPLKWFICPDAVTILVDDCMKFAGCRLKHRCCPMPILRMVAFDREFVKVSPSMSGNGPRIIWGRAIWDYAIDPDGRMYAVLGVTVHGRAAAAGLTFDALAEEKLADVDTKGIADLLEQDEWVKDCYILTDYKTSGSFAIVKWAGIIVEKKDVPVLDDLGQQIKYKTGKRKGEVKTKQERRIINDETKAKKREIELQVNRYRIFFEAHGFPVSQMRVFGIPRDGSTYIAKNRGVMRNKYEIKIKRMQDEAVLEYYRNLQAEVDAAFENNYTRVCNDWEAWGGKRCRDYCEVAPQCQDLCKAKGEKWPGI